MKQITSLLAVIFFTILNVNGQTLEPLDLAKKIFGTATFPELSNYIIGEYDGNPSGKDIPPGTATKFLLLGHDDKKAVVNMTITDPKGYTIDTYLHFVKDGTWKMTAFRSLALTNIIEQMVTDLEGMTTKEVDDRIKKAQEKKDNPDEVFASREAYDFTLGNAKLTLETDENIIKHFMTNQVEFERIKNLALKQAETDSIDDEVAARLVEQQNPDYRKLFISSVTTGGYELGNCINFLIGGILDNTVGYIFVTDKKYLPEMTPGEVIMIREIGNGWYVYKTT